MADECKILDPTAFGLFIVAMVSLPLALWGFFTFLGMDEASADIGGSVATILTIGGLFILIASMLAYRAGSNFGFIVFGLVGAGVIFSGLSAGTYIEITLGVLYLVSLVWSFRAKTLKTLTFILLTTALIYFAVACIHAGWLGDGAWLFLGIAAILNFVLTLYLAFALADEHIRCV